MANHILCMLYSTLFDSSRHIYLSLQFTHVRLYPSSLFNMLFCFQRPGNFPPSVFIQMPLSYLKPLHRLIIIMFFFCPIPASPTPSSATMGNAHTDRHSQVSNSMPQGSAQHRMYRPSDTWG